jgi:hypothetical protein
MKVKNILLIGGLFILSFSLFLMCAGSYSSGKLFSVTEMSKDENITQLGIPAVAYPFPHEVPDGMIVDAMERQAMIDAKIEHLQQINQVFWGGLPDTVTQLSSMFYDVWNFISYRFPGFANLDIDWDAFLDEYMDKILQVENYGQYAYIMTRMGYVLKEGHSQVVPGKMLSNSEDGKEIPLDIPNLYRNKAPVFIPNNTGRIGACYTVTYEEELVITKVWEDSPNPYNFNLGDEIVGLNGVPWHDWIPALEKAGIPYFGSPGAADSAIGYNLLRSAMANVPLFEKINIKRVDTGEIETMDVVYMDPTDDPTRSALVTCTELTETEGLIDLENDWEASWKDDPVMVYGIIEEENIGYMYIKACPSGFDETPHGMEWDPHKTEFADRFEQAVISLMETDGIIIDLRFNVGGRPEPFYRGLSRLIDSEEDRMIFKEAMIDRRKEEITAEDRVNLVDREEVTGEEFSVPVPADEGNMHYDNPIVVMTGPDCISACDMLIAVLSKFEEFTIIGRDTNASSAGVSEQQLWLYNGNDYVFQYVPSVTFYFIDEPHDYLVGRMGFIDEEVWFQKEDIKQGIDSIRQYALDKIRNAKTEDAE